MTVATTDEPGVRKIRISGVRRFIADRMQESLTQAAQLTFHAEADLTQLVARRAAWKAESISIGIEECLIAALARGLAAHPALNGTADNEYIHLYDEVHVAFAVAAPDGLKTPVIRNAANKTLPQLAQERRDLVDRAMTKKLQVSEMKGGTVTLSNLGTTRVQYFTPILNAGQLALLGIGCPTTRVVIDADGKVEGRKFIGLSLTVDHRIVDGEPAARLLTHICESIEQFAAFA